MTGSPVVVGKPRLVASPREDGAFGGCDSVAAAVGCGEEAGGAAVVGASADVARSGGVAEGVDVSVSGEESVSVAGGGGPASTRPAPEVAHLQMRATARRAEAR